LAKTQWKSLSLTLPNPSRHLAAPKQIQTPKIYSFC